jgi:RimJ/RimL family protein N-acetyltransferase
MSPHLVESRHPSGASIIDLDDGIRLLVRPVTPDDRDRLVAGLARLSPESQYLRFMTSTPKLSDGQIDHLLDLDGPDHTAVGAIALSELGMPGVAIARYYRLPDEPEVAEVAVTVIDDYQNKGIGPMLLGILAQRAAASGVTSFRAWVLEENRRAVRILTRIGGRATHDRGVVQLDIDIADILRATGDHDPAAAGAA